MKIGKVSQTVLKRSMLKPLKYRRSEAMIEPSVEEMCYGVEVKEDEQCISSSISIYGDEKDLVVFAMAQVVNDLATRGAKTVGVSVYISLSSLPMAPVPHFQELSPQPVALFHLPLAA